MDGSRAGPRIRAVRSKASPRTTTDGSWSSRFIAAGSVVNGTTFGDDFYGYSKSGIIGASLTFGDQTFFLNTLRPRVLTTGYTADLWFNTKLESASPTKVWAFFSDASLNDLALGGAAVAGDNTARFKSTSSIDSLDFGAYGDLTLTATGVPATVPEPATMVLLGTGLLTLAARVRHNSGQR